MNRAWIACLSGSLVFGVLTMTSPGQERQERGKAGGGFWGTLRPGQPIQVKEAAGRFEIIQLQGLQLGHKVIEVGNDCLVVEDIGGFTETRIPLTSIKSLVKVKLPRE